jgi:two-component system sensor histidine kinase YesM
MSKKTKSIHSIFSKSIIIIAMSIIIVMSYTLYYGFSQVSRDNALQNTKEVITQVNYRLGSYITSISEISDFTNELDFINNKDYSKKKLKTIINSRHDIVSIAFFNNSGEPLLISDDSPILSKNEIIRQQWFYSVIIKKDGDYNEYFSSPHIQHLTLHKYPWVITYSKKISYIDEDGVSQYGVLMIDMNFSLISEMVRSATLGTSGYLFIMDENGNIIYHPKQTLIYAGLFNEDTESIENEVFGTFVKEYNNRERLTVIQTVNDCRWRLVGIVYLDEVLSGLRGILLFVIILAIIFSAIAIILAWFSTKLITSPIKQLEKEMAEIEIETSKLPDPIEGSQEVQALSLAYIEMIKRIRTLMNDIVTAQDLKRKSELEALEAKINPHFLYNTLDSVVWMAEQNETEDVITMVQALSKLFRVSISKGHEIITIKEELEHVSNYLLIQKMRYQNFDFKINVREDLKECPTIKLLIQPIVENAIYHGIKYLVDPGLITITVGSPDNKTIIISVEDNGVGMDEITATQLLNKSKPQKPHNLNSSKGNGIGVINVQERIQLTYGKEYGLTVDSELDEGTTISIKIPKNKAIHQIRVASKDEVK